MVNLVSRNINIGDKRTSVRLEKYMWEGLKDIAKRENMSIHELCTTIHSQMNSKTSFTASLRVFIMLYFKAAATEDGHKKAGHGKNRVKKLSAPASSKNIYETLL